MPVLTLLSSGLYVIRGMQFLRSHRVLWKYAAAPVALSAICFGVAYALVYRLCSWLAAPLEDIQRFGVVLYYLAFAILTALLLLILLFFFGKIVSALAAPFNDAISQKTEELVTGSCTAPPFSLVGLFRDAGRSLAHALKLLGLYLASLILALVFLLIPGLGPFLYAATGVVISALLFAFEYLGYAMDRRRFAWKDKTALFRTRPQSVLGFGLGVVAGGYIPIVNVLLIPAAVVGGTLLFLDLSDAVPTRHGIGGE